MIGLIGASDGGGLAKLSDHIARVRIEGLITGNRKTLDLLKEIEEADRVKALIVHIDSPGGTTAGSEAVHEALRKIAAKKPVASVMGTVAASGGYITAIATDHIVARGNTITGSIGVIFQWAEVTRLLDNLGVKMEEIKSSDLKAEPNMFKPLSEKARQVTQAMVDDSYKWFVDLVEERRKLTREDATRLSDGRVYTGRQAIENKLIDAIGGEPQAVAWLEKERSVSKDLEVVDWKASDDAVAGLLGESAIRAVAIALGLEPLLDSMRKTLKAEQLRLDGLISVWHPNGG
jgi:protease-4